MGCHNSRGFGRLIGALGRGDEDGGYGGEGKKGGREAWKVRGTAV
jgi:hypothetical protein